MTSNKLEAEAAARRQSGAKRWVLDLRGNMGGGVTAAMASAGRLFPKSTKMLVATTRGDEETAYVAETGGRLRVAR